MLRQAAEKMFHYIQLYNEDPAYYPGIVLFKFEGRCRFMSEIIRENEEYKIDRVMYFNSFTDKKTSLPVENYPDPVDYKLKAYKQLCPMADSSWIYMLKNWPLNPNVHQIVKAFNLPVNEDRFILKILEIYHVITFKCQVIEHHNYDLGINYN